MAGLDPGHQVAGCSISDLLAGVDAPQHRLLDIAFVAAGRELAPAAIAGIDIGNDTGTGERDGGGIVLRRLAQRDAAVLLPGRNHGGALAGEHDVSYPAFATVDLEHSAAL